MLILSFVLMVSEMFNIDTKNPTEYGALRTVVGWYGCRSSSITSGSKPINLVELLIVVAELGHSNVKISRAHATLLFRTLIFLQLAMLHFYYSHCDLQLTSCKCIIYSTFTTTVS
jgi:hypothetical protein